MDLLFASHMLNAEGVNAVESIRHRFHTLLSVISPDLAGSGRYESIVRTKLEEARMMAVKAVAVQPRFQQAAPPPVVPG